jgi:signal transduction histidine kinase
VLQELATPQSAPSHTPGLIPLQAIFITHELEHRPRRPPNYQAENRGLVELARGLAQAPESILQRVTEVALELCHAETAGISLIEPYEGQAVFRWRALAGVFAAHLGGMTPRDFSPCGVVVDRRQPQLVAAPERHYPYLAVQPPIVEALLLPFFVAGEVRGTLWLMAHDERRKFDAEDVRVLSSLAEFTAAAYQVREALTSVVRKQAELEQSNRELEQFAAVVSHDLREPLRTITSYTQLLAHRYQGQLDQDADDFMALTVAGAQRMGQRIDALLALAHFSKAGEAFRPTSLQTVLDEVVADLHSQLQAAQATVHCETLPTVRGDAGQLRALFQNLLTNAVKFRHPDRLPHVRLSATKAEDHWEIRVADNGIGIAAAHHERIFEVFRRLHTSTDYEGIGMGLAVCKKIAERHGGHLRVDSTPNQGATFILTLPA